MFEVHQTPLAIVILAGGTGGRMNSNLPKPLHSLAGASLIHHALRTADVLSPQRCVVVVGTDGADITQAVAKLAPDAQIVVQSETCGTGNAALCALSALDGFEGRILVLYADTPLIRPETLRKLVEAPGAVAALGFETPSPYRYGRLIRDPKGGLDRIVESGDATAAEAAVTLCNSGVMAFDAAGARRWLPALSNDNSRNEYYLTDVVGLARSDGQSCAVVVCDADEALGINTRAELAVAEAAFQQRARSEAMAKGVTIAAPDTVYLSFDTQLDRDVTIGPYVVFGPGVVVEQDVEIAAFAFLAHCRIRRGAFVQPFAQKRVEGMRAVAGIGS